MWETGLAVIYDTKTNGIEFIPVRTGEHGISLAKGEDKEQILAGFAKRSETIDNGKWRDGWREFCFSEKNTRCYLSAVKRACAEGATEEDNHLFAHYLDCEAHSDVWREFFPTYNMTNEKD